MQLKKKLWVLEKKKKIKKGRKHKYLYYGETRTISFASFK